MAPLRGINLPLHPPSPRHHSLLAPLSLSLLWSRTRELIDWKKTKEPSEVAQLPYTLKYLECFLLSAKYKLAFCGGKFKLTTVGWPRRQARP